MLEWLRRGKGFERLFFAWLFTLPFGADLLPIQLDGFTLYPGLVLTIALASTSFFTFGKWNKVIKIITLFLLAWLLHALIYSLELGFNLEVKFDLRSLILQFLFAIGLFSAIIILGVHRFYQIVTWGLRSFLFVLLIFGLFEFLTGVHFGSTFSNILKYRTDVVEYYAPMFLYGNPNDYLLYATGILVVLTIVDEQLRARPLLIIGLILVLCVFNISSLSRVSFLTFPVLLSIQLFILFKQYRKIFASRNLVYVLVPSSLMLLLILTNPLYNGEVFSQHIVDKKLLNDTKMVFKDGEDIDRIIPYKWLPLVEQEKIVNHYKEMAKPSDKVILSPDDPRRSNMTRTSLIWNGVDFIQESPILGIGPGQFKYRHRTGNKERDTGTVTGAHNFVIEAISQYGVFGWGYFAFIFYFFILVVRRWKTRELSLNLGFICLFFCLPLFWIMPSSYLYLDLHRLLLPLIALFMLYPHSSVYGK